MMTIEAMKALAEDMARFRDEGSRIELSNGQADAIIELIRSARPEEVFAPGKEQAKIVNALTMACKDIPPEFAQVVNREFWNMLDMNSCKG